MRSIAQNSVLCSQNCCLSLSIEELVFSGFPKMCLNEAQYSSLGIFTVRSLPPSMNLTLRLAL